MRRAKQRAEYNAKRAERAVVKAARSLADHNERNAAELRRERGRGWRATTPHTMSVELARDETARLRRFTTE